MNSFASRRVAHEYTQTNPAAPERVFPLLCPVREADWIPGWRYKLIYSESGVAELGCVFTTEDRVVESEKYSSGSDEELILEKLEPPRSLRNSAEFAEKVFCGGQGRASSQETTWICTDYDPAAFRIAYVWVRPGRVATELWIQLSAEGGQTRSHIRFRYTGLSPEGNSVVESYDRSWFEDKMRGWETSINHYLTTGQMIAVEV
jgi:hypothetical protein